MPVDGIGDDGEGRMIRFLVNAVGTLILALAIVFAIGDIARTIAQDALRIMPMGEAMTLIGVPFVPAPGASGVSVDLVSVIAAWPAAPVLAVLAFLVFLIARPRQTGRPMAR